MSEILSVALGKGNQKFTVVIDGRQFNFQVYYRDVPTGGWYFDMIRFDNGVGIFGLPVLPGYDALAQFQHLEWGHLTFNFDSGLTEPLAYADMDERVSMLWSKDGF